MNTNATSTGAGATGGVQGTGTLSYGNAPMGAPNLGVSGGGVLGTGPSGYTVSTSTDNQGKPVTYLLDGLGKIVTVLAGPAIGAAMTAVAQGGEALNSFLAQNGLQYGQRSPGGGNPGASNTPPAPAQASGPVAHASAPVSSANTSAYDKQADASMQQARDYLGQTAATQARQSAFADQLQRIMNGQEGPSVAEQAARNQSDLTAGQFAAALTAHRGITPGSQARIAAMGAGNAQAQLAGQLALNRAQEQTTARGMYGTQLGNLFVDDLNRAGVAQNLASGESALGQVQFEREDTKKKTAAGVDALRSINAAHGGFVREIQRRQLDDPRKDTVPAMLTPEEIVLPLSVVKSSNPGENAKRFVEAILANPSAPPPGVSARGYAAGGEVGGGSSMDWIVPTALAAASFAGGLYNDAEKKKAAQKQMMSGIAQAWMSKSNPVPSIPSGSVGFATQHFALGGSARPVAGQVPAGSGLPGAEPLPPGVPFDNAGARPVFEPLGQHVVSQLAGPVWSAALTAGLAAANPLAAVAYSGKKALNEFYPQQPPATPVAGSQEQKTPVAPVPVTGSGDQGQGSLLTVPAPDYLPPVSHAGAEKSAAEAIRGSTAAEVDASERNVRALEAQQIAIKAANDQLAETHKREDEKSEAIRQAMLQNKVNPNEYWQNQSVGAKIASVIAIAVNQFSASAQGQGENNFALKAINEGIKQDLDAQIRNVANKNSVYQEYLKAGADRVEAARQARNDLIAVAKAQVELEAAKSTAPLAKAKGQQLLAQLDRQVVDDRQKEHDAQNLLLHQGFQDRIAAGTMVAAQQGQTAKASKEIEGRQVRLHGSGLIAEAVSEPAAEKARAAEAGLGGFLANLKKYRGMAETTGVTGKWFSEADEAKGMHFLLTNSLSSLLEAGVIREGEKADWMKTLNDISRASLKDRLKSIDSVGDFVSNKLMESRKAYIKRVL